MTQPHRRPSRYMEVYQINNHHAGTRHSVLAFFFMRLSHFRLVLPFPVVFFPFFFLSLSSSSLFGQR
jgi:hypothetical protein